MTRDLPTLPELEGALAVVAYIVVRHGDVYAPLLDRLEHEVEEAKRRGSHRDRAQRILDSLPALQLEAKRALPA
jgi:hypothetical protein